MIKSWANRFLRLGAARLSITLRHVIMNILKIPWEQLGPEDFEFLCFELLKRLGFQQVQWRKGGSDKGRDILAIQKIPDPLKGEASYLRYIVECKRYLKPTTVSIDDLSRALSWTDVRPDCDVFLIMTTSSLRTHTREWIEEFNKDTRKGFKIHYVEEHDFLHHFMRYPQLFNQFFSSGAEAGNTDVDQLKSFFDQLSQIWQEFASDKKRAIKESIRLHSRFSKQLPLLGNDSLLQSMYVEQSQVVKYDVEGISRIQSHLKRLNLSKHHITDQMFSIHSAEAIRKGFSLKVDDKSKNVRLTNATQVSFRTDHLVSVHTKLSHPIRREEERHIVYRYAIPHKMPLIGFRYWVASVGSFTANRQILVKIPEGYTISQPKLIHEIGHFKEVTDKFDEIRKDQLLIRTGPIVPGNAYTVQFEIAPRK